MGINIPANDIAVTGARPRWALPTIQFPEDYTRDEVSRILKDFLCAAKALGMVIIGGHTEFVSHLSRPLCTTTAMGLTDRPVFTSTSRPGDTIVQVGDAGIEGTWILACEQGDELVKRGVPEETVKSASRWRDLISVVEDALLVANEVTSMHDATEGGVLQCIYEMARCSGNRFVLDDDIVYREETVTICRSLGLDPDRLISSGCFVATFPRDVKPPLGKVIGHVEEGDGEAIYKGSIVVEETEDELFKAMGKTLAHL